MTDRFPWRRRFVLLVYNLLLPFGLLILLPRSYIKMRRRGGYGKNFWQRFGCYRAEIKQRLGDGPPPIWLHAVSVGEVNVAMKIIHQILKKAPEQRLVLSTTTSTGQAIAQEKAPDNLTVIYSPVDLPCVVARALKIIRPSRIVFVEAEVWPNFARAAVKRGIPLCLANARLSPRSERRYQKFRWWIEPNFSQLSAILVQFPDDVERWAKISGRREGITLTGSVKYDQGAGAKSDRVAEYREFLTKLWATPLPPLVLGASTFPGEETALAKIVIESRAEFPTLKLILVPRHVERCPAILRELSALGLTVAMRKESADPPENPDILLINTTGELKDWQATPDVVIIGKSFLASGGQNPAEALAAGTPVITGADMGNFRALMELLEAADGITVAEDLQELGAELLLHLRDPATARAKAKRGQAVLEKHRGATALTAEIILGME